MPLMKFALRPGVNRENTAYTNEGVWYDVDKVRFRQGKPEKIGGWVAQSQNTFLGVCRSLWGWTTLGGRKFISVGTNLKMYLNLGGAYSDITPIREVQSLTDPFDTVSGSAVVTVTDVAHGAFEGDFVTFTGASAVGGVNVDGEYQITLLTIDTYEVTVDSTASSTANGGGAVTATYQINTGSDVEEAGVGYGTGGYGLGTYGVGGDPGGGLKLWSASNFGEDLFFADRGGSMYYWDATTGRSVRAVYVTALAGASEVPTVVNFVLVSDISRFAFALGANPIGSSTLDPMLLRWSDQEDITEWSPLATNQAGSLRLSRGTEIVTGIQARQEILVWTDQAVYGLQFLGGGDGWGAQLLGDNISIAGPNAAINVAGGAFWMGVNKFYRYDGNVQPLPCDVRRYVFDDFNLAQKEQVCVGLNEKFNEVWWFYPSAESTTNDRYVIYNYLDNLWYYGDMARTAWLGTRPDGRPVAATYNNKLVLHEDGVDDSEEVVPVPIVAFIESGQFDLDDGDRFMFIRRVLPDVTFSGSTSDAPVANITMTPLKNSGSGYSDPASVGGINTNTVTRTATAPIEAFTEQLYLRLRGRQVVFKIDSSALGVAWQLGTPRLDMKADGRRG